jgi:hypothetical protein
MFMTHLLCLLRRWVNPVHQSFYDIKSGKMFQDPFDFVPGEPVHLHPAVVDCVLLAAGRNYSADFPGVKLIKPFSSSLTKRKNKLERFSSNRVFSLI